MKSGLLPNIFVLNEPQSVGIKTLKSAEHNRAAQNPWICRISLKFTARRVGER